MGHYAAEMFVTGSREGDERLFEEERRKDRKNGKAAYNRLLEETELTIDLKELKKGDWLRMKSKFLEDPKVNKEESFGCLPYFYADGGEALTDKFTEGNMFKKNKLGIRETPFVVKGVDPKKMIVYFMPRGLGGTTAERRFQMFRNDKEEYKYALDARMLEYFTGHALQTIKVKDALTSDFSQLLGEEKYLIKDIPISDLPQKYGEYTLKELLDLFSNSTPKKAK